MLIKCKPPIISELPSKLGLHYLLSIKNGKLTICRKGYKIYVLTKNKIKSILNCGYYYEACHFDGTNIHLLHKNLVRTYDIHLNYLYERTIERTLYRSNPVVLFVGKNKIHVFDNNYNITSLKDYIVRWVGSIDTYVGDIQVLDENLNILYSMPWYHPYLSNKNNDVLQLYTAFGPEYYMLKTL